MSKWYYLKILLSRTWISLWILIVWGFLLILSFFSKDEDMTLKELIEGINDVWSSE